MIISFKEVAFILGPLPKIWSFSYSVYISAKKKVQWT